ncbi:MAG: FHA domain-containing protein [Xanthomonadales bacterium]|nr:FHA domain-containing protein [Xanthomonadales bacterium]
MNRHNLKSRPRTIGRGSDCDLVIDDASVSRIHVQVEVTREGYLAVQDMDSRNGSFLYRKGRWLRAQRIVLGSDDRLRLGDHELSPGQLVALFSGIPGVGLREGYAVRGKPLLFDKLLADLPSPKVIFEQPRRNPLTGTIEEKR